MPPDLHPIAAAYRAVRRTGALDLPARRAAVAVYMQAHPLADAGSAADEASRIIAEAARTTPEAMWQGVGGYHMTRWGS